MAADAHHDGTTALPGAAERRGDRAEVVGGEDAGKAVHERGYRDGSCRPENRPIHPGGTVGDGLELDGLAGERGEGAHRGSVP